MNITELKNEGLKREYRVNISHHDFNTHFENRLKNLSPKVRIDGFRSGKVPMGVLKQRYGQSTMMDVANDLVKSGVDRVLSEHKLTPAMQPNVEIENLQEGQDFTFTVSVELTPQVEPKDYTDVQLEKLKVTVDEKTVDEEIEKIAEHQFVTEPIKKARAAKKEDVLVIDFEGKLANGQLIEGGSDKGYHLALGSGSFIPGFEEQLEGANAGDSVEVKLSFPKTYHAKDLAGKEAMFDVKVHEIRERKPAKANEELAKTLGFENLEELKKKVKEDIQANYEGLSRTHMKRQLLDVLAERHDFEVPEGMIETEFNAIWQQLQHALKHAESREEVLGEDAASSEEELKSEYRKIAMRRVRLGLLLAEIGRRQKISVSPEELRQAVVAEARRYPGQEQQVFEFYSKNNEALIQLRAPIFEEKVVDYIFTAVKVLETEIGANEFMKKIEEL